MLGGFALLAIGTLALALAFSELGKAAPRPLRAKATGAMRIADSSANAAILTASAMAPGGSVRGSVEIRNTGDSVAALSLTAEGLREAPGLGGALLSPTLRLTVRDVTAHSDAIVYSGSFGGLHTVRVGALAGGERRRYAFTVLWPTDGTPQADDPLAGARSEVDYRWKLSGGALKQCATRLQGDAGANHLVGTVGGDRVTAGAGRDRIYGRGGRDCIDAGPGRDRVYGGSGEDRVKARDGAVDTIDCGEGDDSVIADSVDVLRNCETVR